MKVIQVLIFIVGVLLLGCTEEVDSNQLLDVDDKIYIQGYLSPSDANISINVSRALSNIGTEFIENDKEEYIEKFIITNAVVQLENENGLIVTIPFVSEENKYQLASSLFPIIEGDSYDLKVEIDGEQYTSSCSIPEKVNDVRYSLNKSVSEFGDIVEKLKISFDDVKGGNDFYIVGGKYNYTIEEMEYLSLLDFGIGRFVTDAIGDGQILSTSGEFYRGTLEEFEEEVLILQVANVDENLYKNLRANYSNQYNDGNPFAEYVIAPDNIDGEGGVGVFAGYNLTENKEVVIEK